MSSAHVQSNDRWVDSATAALDALEATTVEVLTDSLVRVFSFLCRKSSFKVVERGLLIPFSINDRRD